MSDFEDDFSDNRENIDPRRRDFIGSRPIKMPIRNGTESDSGYSITAESSPSLSQATNGLGPSDSEAGPDIADDEFRPANEVFKDPNAFDFLARHGEGSTSAAALARESLYVKFDPLIGGRPSIVPQQTMQSQQKSTSQVQISKDSIIFSIVTFCKTLDWLKLFKSFVVSS